MNEIGETLPALPTSWVWTQVGDITLQPQYGWTTSASKEGNIKLLRTTDITSGYIDWKTVPFCKHEPEDIEKYLLKEGDIVISRAGSVGFSHLVKNPDKAVFASYLIRFRPLINEQYFAYFLKSPYYWKSISEKSLGIAVANVNANKLKQIFIPLAPLPEQHRIVTKIEELFTKLDAGIEQLQKVKVQLKVYRQAVLKSAMTGKLTERWRAEHKDEIEPAPMLLKKINEKKGKKIMPIDSGDLTKAPEEWIWLTLEDYCKKVTDGAHYTPKYISGGIPFITISDINNETIDFSSAKSIGEDDYNKLKENCNPHSGDILFSKDGTVGKVIEINFEGKFIVLSSLAIIRPFTDLTFTKYLKYLLQSKLVLNQATQLKTGTALTRIILRNLKTVRLPIPSILEQQKIVEEIEKRFSVLDETEKIVKQGMMQAERLRQSILKKAFEGKLVSQDPTDEPASVLLERIKTEKERLKQTGNKKSKKYLTQERLI